MNQNIILSTAYFPNLQYCSKIIKPNIFIIERYEHFEKQSFRNRCEILSPNGKQILTVPIIKQHGQKQKICDVKIDYRTDWQQIHLKALQSSYLSSPFYEFYIDAILPVFEKRTVFLFDLNVLILEVLINEIQLDTKLVFSKEYVKKYDFLDFRNTIHPKKKNQIEDTSFYQKEYTQVFSNKFSFVENLSILDLLFNEGPNSLNLLQQMSH